MQVRARKLAWMVKSRSKPLEITNRFEEFFSSTQKPEFLLYFYCQFFNMIQNMKTIGFLKKCLRNSLIKGVDEPIKSLRELLDDNSPKYDDLILLQSRLEDLNRKVTRGTISEQFHQLERNKIHESLIDLIDKIDILDIEGGLGNNNEAVQGTNSESERLILKTIHALWDSEEQFIEKLLDDASTFTSREKLRDFIQSKFEEFSRGEAYDALNPAPSDFTLTLINSPEGTFFFHPDPRQIGRNKKDRDHYKRVLEIKSGTFIWPNDRRSEQYRTAYVIPEPKASNPNWRTKCRLTKVYFREIPRLGLIVTFEDHINLRSRVPKRKHFFTKIYLAFKGI